MRESFDLYQFEVSEIYRSMFWDVATYSYTTKVEFMLLLIYHFTTICPIFSCFMSQMDADPFSTTPLVCIHTTTGMLVSHDPDTTDSLL